jgi:site-specific recombinase XerD
MQIQLAAQQFCDHSIYFRGFSKQTIARYRQAINYYCNFSGFTELEQITNKSIREMFLNGRLERRWKPATFISCQKSLSVFFKWCIAQTFMSENPIADLESPRLERRLPRGLSKEQAFRLLEAVYNYPYTNDYIRLRNHAIFSMFLFAGLRKQEILQLRYTDVDLATMTVFINNSKGNKDRVIPINASLAASLSKYLTERKKRKKTCVEFFTSSLKNRGLSEKTLLRMIDLARVASGLSFSAHKLRHTFATLMVQGGCDIYSLSKMMGHEDIRTTTLYLSASTEHLRSQIFKHPLNKRTQQNS